MSSPLESSTNGNDAWRAREEILNRFEIAWRETGDALIEHFLPAEEAAGRDELLCELIKIDLEYRWENGAKTGIEHYFKRFPQLLNSEATVLDLIREEVALRCFHGCPPTAAELSNRFSDRNFDWVALCRSSPHGSISRHDTPPVSSISSTLIPGDRPKSDAASPRRAVPRRLGRFEIQEVIGRGGFATVYRAWDPELQRDVAIKVPDAPLLMDDSIKRRLLREATSAARLRHPAIVAIHEVSKDENCPFIVYEFIPGPTLAQVMGQTAPSPQQAAQWTARIAEALEYAHANGIVHRDVKPANIMMGRDGLPLLADFGLAMQTEAACTLTQEGDVLGTPAYMSPEQAAGRGHAADARTDVYALGVVLYELLCGRLPFQGTGASVLHRVIHEEPLAPRNVRSHVPVDLETICLRAMAKEPMRRYPSAGAMAEDLQRYLNHRPILARRLGIAGRMMLWCRRQPALAATIALAILGVATVGSISFFQVIRERDHFHQERDRAQANLYRALAGETRALMKARDTAWWWKAMENIETAARLDTAPRDLGELRELAIECMGTRFPCFHKRASLPGASGSILSVALNADASLAAAASANLIHLWNLPAGEVATVLKAPAPVARVAFDPQGHWLISALRNGELEFWDLRDVSTSLSDQPVKSQIVPLGGGRISSLRLALDGSWIAAGCVDGTIRLLTKGTSSSSYGAPRTLRAHKGTVTCFAVSPDGRTLASGSEDRTIRFWDPFAGEPFQTLGVPSAPNSLSFSADATAIFWSDHEGFGFSGSGVRENVGMGVNQLHTGIVIDLICDRANRLLTGSFDGTMRLWEKPSSRTQELAVARTESNRVLSMAWNLDRRWVLAGSEEGRVELWELVEPSERTLGLDACQSAAFIGKSRILTKSWARWDFSKSMSPSPEAFSPPAVTAIVSHPLRPTFAYGNVQGEIHLCGEGGASKLLAREQGERIAALAGSPDGRRFASAGSDGRVGIWDWSNGSRLDSFSTELGNLSGLGWTSDSERLAILGSRGAALWDLQANKAAGKTMAAGKGAVAVACGGKWIALGLADGPIRLCDQSSGAPLRMLRGHSGRISALAFSSDGRQLASAADDKTLRIWDPATGQETAHRDLQGTAPPWLAFQPNGTHLVSGSLRNSATTVWDGRNLVPLASVKDHIHPAGCFLAGGARIILGENSGAVSVIRMAEAQGYQSIQSGPAAASGVKWIEVSKALTQGGHVGEVWGVAASPDGRWIATASHDQTVKIWNAQTKALVHTLSGHGALCWSVAFSADSKYLAMGAGDVIVWEAETGKEVRCFRGHKQLVTGVAFHPRFGWLASSSYDGSVRLWDVVTGNSLGKLHQFNGLAYGLSITQDGTKLAVGFDEGCIGLWYCGAWGPEWLDRGREQQKANPLAAEPDREVRNPAGPIRSVAFDRDGHVLASGSEQGAITLWDADTLERTVTLRGGTGQIRGLCFSDDGALLAGSAYASPTIVWDMTSLRARLRSMNLDW